MANYIKFRYMNEIAIGLLEGETIQPCSGHMFENPQPVGARIAVSEVEMLPPCTPRNFLALWNNFYSRASKEGWQIPPEPLYFAKMANSLNAHQQPIPRPISYDGPVVFEGELGIVIGKTCRGISEAEAKQHIFGYTCVNDVTAKGVLFRDASFPQWIRAKGFDGFGVIGPGIVTDIEPHELVVQSILDGELMQNYTVSDMIFQPYKLVSLISQDISLEPGDVIACGTALGAGPMADGQTITIKIDGVGALVNVMSAAHERPSVN